MDRRIHETTSALNVAETGAAAVEDTRFVYDGWNLVQEIDGLVTVTSGVTDVAREYTWGLDLSGQSGNPSVSGIHGAGGIGGLLGTHWTNATTSTSDDKAYIYFYDANGNVGQMIDIVSGSGYGTIAAKYEYYPFGGLLMIDGVAAEANPFRFSTKYRDNETGCYYYGFRYLRTKHGRWLSKDPIGEKGGFNLVQFAKDNPLGRIDPFGLCCPGTMRNIRCEFRIHSDGSTPDLDAERDELISSLDNLDTLATILELAKIGASAGQLIGKTEAEIRKWLIENSAELTIEGIREIDVEGLGKRLKEVLEDGYGNRLGFRIFTRIKYDHCIERWWWRNYFETKDTGWHQHETGGSTFFPGLYQGKLNAYTAAISACKERQALFEEIFEKSIVP